MLLADSGKAFAKRCSSLALQTSNALTCAIVAAAPCAQLLRCHMVCACAIAATARRTSVLRGEQWRHYLQVQHVSRQCRAHSRDVFGKGGTDHVLQARVCVVRTRAVAAEARCTHLLSGKQWNRHL